MDIFDYHAQKAAASSMPLAERMRPRHLDEFVGQHKAVGEGSLIRHAIETDRVFSMILWGPPGCGKTMIARATAGECGARFQAVAISDILDPYWGVAEQRLSAIFEKARNATPTILFFDEIDALGERQQAQAANARRRGFGLEFGQAEACGQDCRSGSLGQLALVLAIETEDGDAEAARFFAQCGGNEPPREGQAGEGVTARLDTTGHDERLALVVQPGLQGR